MVWKGLSLGAVPSVLAAAAHPDCGLIVDQAFLKFSNAIAQVTLERCYNLAPKQVIQATIAAFLKANDLEYRIDHALPHVQGTICVINNQFDGVIHPAERALVADFLPKGKDHHIIEMKIIVNCSTLQVGSVTSSQQNMCSIFFCLSSFSARPILS